MVGCDGQSDHKRSGSYDPSSCSASVTHNIRMYSPERPKGSTTEDDMEHKSNDWVAGPRSVYDCEFNVERSNVNKCGKDQFGINRHHLQVIVILSKTCHRTVLAMFRCAFDNSSMLHKLSVGRFIQMNSVLKID